MRYLRAPPFLGVGGLGRRAGAPPGRSSSGRCRPLMAALDLFSDPARDWFRQAFGEPTDVQEKGWLEVAAGRHTLMSAPTGSGKTLAAFYWCLDRLAGEPIPAVDARCRVLYVSPLKALTVDVERNLRAPLAGLALQAERLGLPIPEITVGVRTGDTAPDERRQLNRRPPDILITTPESLFLVLTSAARSMLRSVRWVIVDEIHSLAPNKRGAHLALSLERLAARTAVDPQRIGLSATVRPLDEVARFLGGTDREVAIVDAGRRKSLEVTVEVPVDDMANLGDREQLPSGPAAALGGAADASPRSIWPAIYPRLLELIRQHRSTIVFVNSRRLAERLAARLNELAEEELAALVRRAHPFRDLGRRSLDSVLDMLSGRYPSDEFAELRPRIVWDRVNGTVRGRAGAQRLAVTSGGTIPDRGLYTVNLLEDGRRVGELDEEMVYETRPGENFILGATTWRVADITASQVLVTPAPGEPGKLAFWKGDAEDRPVELGQALGRFLREVRSAPAEKAEERLIERAGFDERATRNLLAYLDDQAQSSAVPDDRTVVIERFRDELGDWPVCVLTPLGGKVHAPWALALKARLQERFGQEVAENHSDDGFALRLPDADTPPGADELLLEPEEVRDLVTAQLHGSALFAARFRDAAAC